jgi:hypothetical protein
MKYYQQETLNTDKAVIQVFVICFSLLAFIFVPPILLDYFLVECPEDCVTNEYVISTVMWLFMVVFSGIALVVIYLVYRLLLAIYRVYIRRGIKEK